jgi:hypothetical protein
MENTIALACPPEGFSIDPAPAGCIPKQERLIPFLSISPITIGITLEETLKGGQSTRILQAKSGLDQKFNPPKA